MADPIVPNNFKQRFKDKQYLKELHKFAEGTLKIKCDKCSGPVVPENSVSIWDYLLTSGHWINYFNSNRHMEPVTDKHGVVICEGSPSRWQKIAGIPDSRPEYRDESGPNDICVAAWELMQREFQKPMIGEGGESKE